MSILSIKTNKHVNDCIYTKYYINKTVEFGGICYRITGIKPTKAIIKVAREPIRLAKPGSWKNIHKFTQLSKYIGKNIVAKVNPGYLYKGILKWANWKNYGFTTFWGFFDFKRNYFYVLSVSFSLSIFLWWTLLSLSFWLSFCFFSFSFLFYFNFYFLII